MAGEPFTPSLHDRARELARIASRLAEARAGDGGLTVIEGPAGIGKTSLMQEALVQAERAGMQALAARGSELEREYAFGVLRQALERPLAELGADRDEVTAGHAAHALALFDPARPAPSSESLLHGVYWLVANLAERRPVVLAVDDAQWADESSVLALAYLARRVHQLPVAIVVCTRPLDSEAGSALGALVMDGAAERLLPAPLGAEAVSAISASDDPAFVQAALSVTGGNPFLLHQLLLELDGERSATAVVGIQPRELGRHVLARLSEPARSLAFAIGVLGERSTLAECAALAELGDATDSFHELVAAGVLADDADPRFRHPLIAAAVTAGLSSARRATWHARAAQLLRDRGADVERQAIHLVACPPRGDPVVAKVLSEAAERALARAAPIEAAPLLRRALEEPPAAEDRPRLLLARGEVLTMVGDPEAAATFAEAARTSRDPEVRAAALEARGWWWALDPAAVERDLEVIDELLASLPDTAEALRARVEAVRLAVASRSAPVMRDAVARAERLGLLAEDRSAHPDLLATTALWCVPIGALSVQYALRAVRAAADAPSSFPPSLWVPFTFSVLVMGERHEEAREVAGWLQRLARENGSPTWYGLGTALQVRRLLDAGSLLEAEAEAVSSVEAVAHTDGWMNILPRTTLVDVLVARGRQTDAEDHWRALGLPDDIPEVRPMLDVLMTRARLRRAGGDGPGALRDVREAFRRYRRLGPPSINDQPARLLAAQLEDRGTAVAMADEAIAIAERWGTPGAIGEALRVRGVVEGDIDALRAAVERLEASPLRLAHAQALAGLGALLRRRRARREAREPLLAALELARTSGADGLAEHVGEELAASGATVPPRAGSGSDSLTASERRIARMAAVGASNKEIAQELFLSVKTIEMHLGHAYRKLDISSRRDLSAALADAR
jgi:DNA-binding CsgD family transcriptional regulator